MAQILIKNLTNDQFSFDVKIDDTTIRRTIAKGATVDIGDEAAIDDVNENATVKQLVAAGTISVTAVPDATDLPVVYNSFKMIDTDTHLPVTVTIASGVWVITP